MSELINGITVFFNGSILPWLWVPFALALGYWADQVARNRREKAEEMRQDIADIKRHT
jgi:hypothetical protein